MLAGILLFLMLDLVSVLQVLLCLVAEQVLLVQNIHIELELLQMLKLLKY